MICWLVGGLSFPSQSFAKEVSFVEEKAPFPGYLYRPDDDEPHPVIILLHGSEGGNGNFWMRSFSTGKNSFTANTARYFASQGFVSYALCYFDCKHQKGYESYPPDELVELDLEYTIEAIREIRKSKWAKGQKIVLMGFSRGAEQALLIASLLSKTEEGQKDTGLPDVVIVHAPPNVAALGFSKENAKKILAGKAPYKLKFEDSSWKYKNELIKAYTPIEIEHYKGALLVSNGGQDQVWGPTIFPEKLRTRYDDVQMKYLYIEFREENSPDAILQQVRANTTPRLFMFYEEEGHSFREGKKALTVHYGTWLHYLQVYAMEPTKKSKDSVYKKREKE